MATTLSLRPEVSHFLGGNKQLLIGGQWVDSSAGETYETLNPATGEVLTRVASATVEDVDRAVKAARAAFTGPWRKMVPAERERLLWRLADLMEQHFEELTELETIDGGKVRRIAGVEVKIAIDHFRYYAGWPSKLEGNTIPVSIPGTLNYTLREPVGVCGLIIPWNFPIVMASWKLAPALACGCTTILKPAGPTPLTALRIGELAQEAGFPEGVMNIITGSGALVGSALVRHPEVDKIAFTGSTEVGKRIAQESVENVKRVSLELGGKSPNIVLPDADLDGAVRGAFNAIFYNQGQVCTAGSRLFAERSIAEELTERLADRARKTVLGNGLDPKVQMGPVVSETQMQTVLGYIESGLREGAKAVSGGKRASGDGLGQGYFVEPTVFSGTTDEMTVTREEIFGPVVVVLPFDDLEDVARRANNSPYGLAAGIWTRDISKAHRLAGMLKAGTVWINCYNVFDAASPFGGYKQSGYGREHGHAALELYTEVKSVWTKID